jgi:hypothetical protein
MSEFYDTPDYDNHCGHEYQPEHDYKPEPDYKPEHFQPQYGYEHDERYSAESDAEASRHDKTYEHGHHVEYDNGPVHFEESEYTNYSEHDANAKAHYEVDYAEKEKFLGEAERYFGELPQGGEYEGRELQGLPQGLENFDHDYKGSEYEGKEYEGKEYEGKEYEGKGYEGKEYEGKGYEGAEYQGATDPDAVESVVSK